MKTKNLRCTKTKSIELNLEEDAQLLEAGDGGEGEAGHLLAEQHPLVAPARANSLLQFP